MSQTEFLKVFNDLEQTLQNKYDSMDTIYELLDREKNAVENNPVKANWEILDISRRLRNILAHETKTNLPVVATPSQQIIEVLKKVTDAYQHPKLLVDFLQERKREKIRSFTEDTLLTDVLKMIHEKHFNQFPVFGEKGYVGVISNHGIAHWLAAQSEKEQFSIKSLHEAKIADILPFESNGETVMVLSKKATQLEAFHHLTGTKIRAIIVCHQEKPIIHSPQDIAGIITKSDLGDLAQDLQWT